MTGPDDAQILVKFEAMNAGAPSRQELPEHDRGSGGKGADPARKDDHCGAHKRQPGHRSCPDRRSEGYKTIIIMPDSVSEERRKLVRHYGAEVRLIHDAGNIGKCIDECMETALKMAAEDPDVYVPQQFENEANTRAQKEQTGREILEQAGIPIHGFCSGIGTGGTITGVGEALKEANPDIEIWAAEPEHAAILSGGKVGTHLQMGIGDGVIPAILNQEIYDHIAS